MASGVVRRTHRECAPSPKTQSVPYAQEKLEELDPGMLGDPATLGLTRIGASESILHDSNRRRSALLTRLGAGQPQMRGTWDVGRLSAGPPLGVVLAPFECEDGNRWTRRMQFEGVANSASSIQWT